MFEIDELTRLGINIDEALERFMGKQSLFEKILKKFPKAVEQYEVLAYFESKEYDIAVANAHTLKGTTGNLSITPLFMAYTEIVNLLRANKPDEAKVILEKVLPVQEEIINYINDNAD